MDRAPAHFAIDVRYLIDNNYIQWFGGEAPVVWPPKSLDRNHLEFYFWGRKDLVYARASNTRAELLVRIQQAIQQIKDNPHEIKAATSSAQACIQQEGIFNIYRFKS